MHTLAYYNYIVIKLLYVWMILAEIWAFCLQGECLRTGLLQHKSWQFTCQLAENCNPTDHPIAWCNHTESPEDLHTLFSRRRSLLGPQHRFNGGMWFNGPVQQATTFAPGAQGDWSRWRNINHPHWVVPIEKIEMRHLNPYLRPGEICDLNFEHLAAFLGSVIALEPGLRGIVYSSFFWSTTHPKNSRSLVHCRIWAFLALKQSPFCFDFR